MRKKRIEYWLIVLIFAAIVGVVCFISLEYEKVKFSPLESCEDGTLYGKCSSKGLYCDSGKLKEDCRLCGCVKQEKQMVFMEPKDAYASTREKEEEEGYIIELKSSPLLKNRNVAGYKSKLKEEHLAFKQRASSVLSKNIGKDVRIFGEFEDAFNGLALDITKEECEVLKRNIELVKECYPNLKVHAYLDKSLPVTKTDALQKSFGLTGKDVVIAIIDTGIDASHESLDDLDDNPDTNDLKVIGFKDYVNFRKEPYDDYGHGTHCAGIAAGTGGESGRFKGVAPQAKLVGVKVLDEWGGGTFSGVIAGIEWVIQNKEKYNISIASMSLGARSNSDGTTPVEIAVTTGAESGINFVVAAGNAGSRGFNTVGIPASAKKIITVGAVDNEKNLAYFSSKGPTKDGRIKPEVVAPGVSITAPDANTGNEYASHSGTSMATPHVSGVVALLLEANSSLNTEEMRQILMDNALDRGEIGPDNEYGWGVVDALKSFMKIKPQQHEIIVEGITSDDTYDTNTPVKVRAKIKNYGMSNEANLDVRFFVNGVEQGRRKIVQLSSESETFAELIFALNLEGTYTIKVSVEPVAGETAVQDNELSKEIVIKDYVGKIKAVVLDSWGTYRSDIANWDYLDENWFNYGNYKVDIDYKTFDKKETSYEMLRESKADVLIISDAWQDGRWITGTNWEFSDSEIDAIKRYVSEGHGLIITSGTLSVNAPGNVENNMKLAPLVGIDEDSKPYWSKEFEDTGFALFYLKHLLFTNLKDYAASYWLVNTGINLSRSNPGDVLAQSYDKLGLIIGHYYGAGNTIYFSHMPEIEAWEQDLQLFYNSILWAKQKYEEKGRNIKVKNLELKDNLRYGSEESIRADIINKGESNEDGLNVGLMIDDEKKQSINISLGAGEVRKIEFNFSADKTGTNSVMIFSEERNESRVYDNYLGKNVFVPSAYIDSLSEHGEDNDGNGLIDYIVLNVGIDVVERSYLYLHGILSSFLGAEISEAYGYGNFDVGKSNLTLNFSGLGLKMLELNGPYKISNINLKDERGGEELLSILTANYSYSEFESYPDLVIEDIDVDELVVVNETFSMYIGILNAGTEDADESVVNLHRVKYDEMDRDRRSLELIGSEIIENISVSEEREVEFELNFSESGRIEIMANVSNLKDKNLENNIHSYWFEILPKAAVVRGWFEYPENKVIQNKPLSIRFFVENRGVETAKNVNVSIYKEDDYGKLSFITSKNFGELASNSEKSDSFSFMPDKLGRVSFVGNISADNSYYREEYERRFYLGFDVVPDGADVTGWMYPEDYPLIVGENATLLVNIENIGTKKAEGVGGVVYKKNESQLIEISRFNIGELDVDEWERKEVSINISSPEHNEFVLKISATNDMNQDNNEISRSFYAHLRSPDLGVYHYYDSGALRFNNENNITIYVYNSGIEEAENVKVWLYNESDDLIGEKEIGNLAREEMRMINFSFVPVVKGRIQFKVNVSADNEEDYYTENNEQYFSIMASEGADLRIYMDYVWSNLVNSSTEIRTFIENRGVETATNVEAEFYLWNNDKYVLLESVEIGNISPMDRREINFSYISPNLGYILFLINASADNEEDYGNNARYFDIYFKGDGPDIRLYIDSWWQIQAIVNKKVLVPYRVVNYGNKEAVNISVELYSVRRDESGNNQYTKIAQKTIDSLGASQEILIEFPYTPVSAGEVELMLNASVENESYMGDNNIWAWLNVLSSVSDVSGEIFFYEQYGIYNKTNYIDLLIRDNDIMDENNVGVRLYDNGGLILDSVIDLLNASSSVLFDNILWIPNHTGMHNLTLVVEADGDVNLNNNVYTMFVEVYGLRNVVFSIANSSRALSEGYVSLGGKRFFVSGREQREILELRRLNIGIDGVSYGQSYWKEAFVSFEESSLRDEMNITSELYTGLNNGSLVFGIVYANKPEFNFMNMSYYILYYAPDETIRFAEPYSCNNWSFSDKRCNSAWIKEVENVKYFGEDGIYVSGETGSGVDAIGLAINQITGVTGVTPLAPGESGGGGGGGGGGGSGWVKWKKSKTYDYPAQNVSSEIRLSLRGDDSDLEFLGLKFINQQQAGIIKVGKLDSLDNLAPIPLGKKVYAYFEITHPGLNNLNIADGNIIFKVPKQWMADNSIEADNIILMRYENGWRELLTGFYNFDSLYNYYKADINALSVFAIATKSDATTVSQSRLKYVNYIIGINVAVLIVIVLLFVLFRRRKPSDKTSFLEAARRRVGEFKSKGYSNEEIRKVFRAHGWKDEDISKILP